MEQRKQMLARATVCFLQNQVKVLFSPNSLTLRRLQAVTHLSFFVKTSEYMKLSKEPWGSDTDGVLRQY